VLCKCIHNSFKHLTLWDRFVFTINPFKNSKSAIEFEDPENPNQILKIKGPHIFDRHIVIGSIVVCCCCIFTIR
jgi:hypothetical protein